MGTLIRDQLTGQIRRPRLLLADDHTIVLEGITRLLQAEYDLLPPASDGQLLVETAMQTNPDVIVADISMPILNGIEAVRQIRKKGLKAKVIFLSMHADIEWAAEALAVGASGYVIKQSAAEELSHAIQEALRNRTYITPRVVRDKESMKHVAAQHFADRARTRSASTRCRRPHDQWHRRNPEGCGSNRCLS